VPIAMFTLGPTRAEEDVAPIRTQMDEQIAKYPWLKPVAVALFGGKYDPTKLKFPLSLLAAMPASPLYQAPASDVRDWDAIQAWASDLPAKL